MGEMSLQGEVMRGRREEGSGCNTYIKKDLKIL